MDNWSIEKWYKRSIVEQMANIGGEIHSTIRRRNEGDLSGMIMFCNKAIEFLERSISDPKNADRKEELEFRVEELKDYFFGENKYNTTDESLINYYDFFIKQYYLK